jgi:hypothetical protein
MHRFKAVVNSLAVGCLLPTAVQAWTAPLTISGGSDVEPSVPKVARGSGGKIHLAYRRKGPDDWRVCYCERSGTGTWNPVEVISVPWSDRPDIIEDADGRAHMFYTGRDAGGKTDLFEAYKQGGAWMVNDFSNTTTHFEDYARLAIDSLGHIHLVHTRGTVDYAGDVIYRVWNGSWSGETILGQITDNFYYHRPDISIDSANGVHVVWCNTEHSLTYRGFSGGVWSAPLTLGATTEFFSYPKVAAATAGSIVAVTFDQLPSGPVLKYAASSNGGANWSSLQYLNDGHYPNMDTDTAGNVHLVYEWSPANYTGYRKWDGSTWTAPVQASPSSRWQGWPDVAADTGGTLHVVYDDGSASLTYVQSGVDSIPPGQVSGFNAIAGHGRVQLSWTNPSDLDFVGTIIRYKTTGYPTGPADGSLLCSRPAAPGSADGLAHSDAVNGTTYYYAAFAYDVVPNYSAGVHASATPHVAPDFDEDGDVDQKDFGHLQACFSGAFVPQEAPECQDACLDSGDDVDAEDLAVLLGCLSGKDTAADPHCAG